MFIVGESCLPGSEVEGSDIQSKVGLFVFVEYHFCGVMIDIFDSKHSKKRKRIVRWQKKLLPNIYFPRLEIGASLRSKSLVSWF